MRYTDPSTHGSNQASSIKAAGVFKIGGWNYIAPHAVTGVSLRSAAVTALDLDYSGGSIALASNPLLLTAFNVKSQKCVSEAWMKASLQEAQKTDDVFRNEFLQGVLFITETSSSIVLEDAAKTYLKDIGVKWIGTLSGKTELRAGPHIELDDMLRPVLRVIDDTHGAFLHALGKDEAGNYYPLKLHGEDLETLSVAVPSRLANSPSATHKLSGLRIGVKDIFKIKGVPTSVCNKAWFHFHRDSPPSRTAACIDILTKLGAVIVGTTKLASFAATEEPVECVDYQAPWNPRADGYQSPAGSSSGSGAAIGAYDWLDIAIGSDTSGSGRRPGHWNGCIAMRPTHGVLPCEGYIPSFSRFDQPTFFGRELISSREFAEAWYGSALTPPPSTGHVKLIYATDYMTMITNETQLAIIDRFVEDLEKSLGVRHDKVSFDELWSTKPPQAAGDASLQDFMKDVSRNSFFYDDYHNFDTFRNGYAQRFGKPPYVSPPVRWQWQLSSTITRNQRDTAVKRLDVYRDWFFDTVMDRGRKDALVLIPIENISPRYRDDPPLPHFNPIGVPNLFVSPILGAPELTVPIGTSAYTSKVTGKIEHLPVAISIIGEPGRDLDLFDIAYKCLKTAGRPTAVKTGAELFEVS